MKKKIFDVIYWTLFIAISLWIVVSFMNVNYTNVTDAELASWNFFEILCQLAEEGM